MTPTLGSATGCYGESAMRDNFPARVIDVLAKRAGVRCSLCGQTTSGPAADPDRAVNLGVAAHIKAASPKEPRYDPEQTPAQRMDIQNGIWLCQNHAKLIDHDDRTYNVAVLIAMKMKAEEEAERRLRGLKLLDIDDYLEKLRGVPFLSSTGRVTYTVAEVVRDSHVSVTGGKRKRPVTLSCVGEAFNWSFLVPI